VSPSTSLTRSTSRQLAPVGAVTLLLLLVLGLLVAHAAAIGLSSNKLAGFDLAGSPSVPTPLAYTDFTGTDGQSITAVPLSTGQTWTINAGNWTIQGNEATHNNTPMANAWVPVGTTSAAVQATLSFPATARRAGVTLLGDATSYLYAVVDNGNGGQVLLYKRVGTTSTLLGSKIGVGLPATAVLRVEAFTNTINVYFAGTLVITYTLTPAEVTQFKAATHVRYGIIADSDPQTNFSDFLVEGP
jgi:hypothetical protein